MYISSGWIYSVVCVFLVLSFYLWWQRRENNARKEVLHAIYLWATLMERHAATIVIHPHLPEELGTDWIKHVLKMIGLFAQVDDENRNEAEHLSDLAREIDSTRWLGGEGGGTHKRLIEWANHMTYNQERAKWKENELVRRADALENMPQFEEAVTNARAKLREALTLKTDAEPNWIEIAKLLCEGVAIIEQVAPEKPLTGVHESDFLEDDGIHHL